MNTSNPSADNIHIDNVDKGAAVATGQSAQANVTQQQTTASERGVAVVGDNYGNIFTGDLTITPPLVPPRLGSAPPQPSLVIGREDDLRQLKTRLGVGVSAAATIPLQILTAVRGWPGVGKTTMASVLAYDADINIKYPDGILWASLGSNPNLFSEIMAWGRALGADDLQKTKTIEEASARLAALLRHKRMLLIVDDAWDAAHVKPFNVGGRGCALLVTTRITQTAQALAPTPDSVYLLKELSDEKAMELLQALAPNIVAKYPELLLAFVRELEGLPLALQVAGHWLHVEDGYGFDVEALLSELRAEAAQRQHAKLMATAAPANRIGSEKIEDETNVTVAALFQKSTERLDAHTRDCFAYLGVFVPKPATFDLAAVQAVWQVAQVTDPKPIIRNLVERGLLEFVRETGRYQMHALLVMHAKSLFME